MRQIIKMYLYKKNLQTFIPARNVSKNLFFKSNYKIDIL